MIFLKPKDQKKPPVAVRVYRNGREACNLLTKEGRDIYMGRKRVAWEAQGKKCAICHLPLTWADSTVDHITPRGMGGGSRDDRQQNIAAVHGKCNMARGSQRVGFYDFIDVP